MARPERVSMLNKVPRIDGAFWVIKILATTVGETGADGLAASIDPVVAYGLIAMAFTAALAGQLRARRYVLWLYWLTVVLMSVAGTLVTDAVTDGLGISLYLSSAVFAVALAATFAAWFASERTLSIHTILTARRERYYWLAVLFTFALGTAVGDLLAEQVQLGYAVTTLAVAALIGMVAVAYALGVNPIFAFWAGYVLTRPLGAGLGDWLSQPVELGGLGLGAVQTSLVFLAMILGLVLYLTWRRDPGRLSTAAG